MDLEKEAAALEDGGSLQMSKSAHSNGNGECHTARDVSFHTNASTAASVVPPNGNSITITEPNSSSSSTTLKDEVKTEGEDRAVVENGAGTGPEEVLTKKRKTIIVCALCLCVLMAAMDQTIVTTAIPVIVEGFDSPSGYTWIGTAYLLLASAFLPSWGKFSDIFGRKPVLLIACTIFLVGSILCAVAQNMVTVIAGRAVQGLGAGGLVGLVNVTISDLVAVRERGVYLAFVGFTWAFASAIGPILGGIFTQYVSWRLCFWINVPLTVMAMTALSFFLHLHRPTISLWEGLKRVDWLGTILIVSGTVLFLLGLEFGGISQPWKSPIVLCFLIFGGAIMIAFILVEWKFAKLPLMPLRLFSHRTTIASYMTGFFHGFVFIGGCYFLPLYFQAVRGTSVLMSGVSILPYVIILSVASAVTGQVISKTGRYQEIVWGGALLMTIGAGLLSDLDRNSGWVKLFFYQAIAGTGCGPLFQGPLIAIHSLIDQKDVGTATVTFAFLRNLATALGISLGLVVFQNVMDMQTRTLTSLLPADTIRSISGNTASASIPFIATLPADQRDIVRDAYGKGIQAMWFFYLACAVGSLLASAFIGKHILATEVKSTQGVKNRKRSEGEEKV